MYNNLNGSLYLTKKPICFIKALKRVCSLSFLQGCGSACIDAFFIKLRIIRFWWILITRVQGLKMPNYGDVIL